VPERGAQHGPSWIVHLRLLYILVVWAAMRRRLIERWLTLAHRLQLP